MTAADGNTPFTRTELGQIRKELQAMKTDEAPASLCGRPQRLQSRSPKIAEGARNPTTRASANGTGAPLSIACVACACRIQCAVTLTSSPAHWLRPAQMWLIRVRLSGLKPSGPVNTKSRSEA